MYFIGSTTLVNIPQELATTHLDKVHRSCPWRNTNRTAQSPDHLEIDGLLAPFWKVHTDKALYVMVTSLVNGQASADLQYGCNIVTCVRFIDHRQPARGQSTRHELLRKWTKAFCLLVCVILNSNPLVLWCCFLS